MSETPRSKQPWPHVFLAHPENFVLCLLLTGAAWYLGPADFGPLQAGLALAAWLAMAARLHLDDAVAQEIRARPDEIMETLGTAMALRAIAGGAIYLLLAMVLPAQIAGKSHAVWLVAAIAVVLQAPLAFRQRFENRETLLRRAEQIGFAVSAIALGFLIWHGGSGPWFAAATLIAPTLSALIIFFAHMRLAPDEETFTCDWKLAGRWLRASAPKVGGALLDGAWLGLTPTWVAFSGGPVAAGVLGIALLYLVCGYDIAVRFEREADFEHTAAQTTPSAAWLGAAQVGWAVTAVFFALMLIVRFVVLRSEYKGLEWVLLPIGLSLPMLVLGARRNEIWRAQKQTRAVACARAIGLSLALPGAAWAAHAWGAAAAGIAIAVGVILDNMVSTLFFGSTDLARQQWRALFLRGEPAPAAPKQNVSNGTNSGFFGDSVSPVAHNMGAATTVARDSAPGLPAAYPGLKTHDPA